MGANEGLVKQQSAPTLIPGVRSFEPATDQVNQLHAANARRTEITKAVQELACDKYGREVRPVKIRMKSGVVLSVGLQNAVAVIERGDATLVQG